MKALLLTLALAAATLQTKAPPQTSEVSPQDAERCPCSIEVTVKHPGTGEPIAEVKVSIALPGINRGSFQSPGPATGNDGMSATTDSSGRVVFRNLAEAIYLVTAQREGYFGLVPSSDAYPAQASANVSVGPTIPANQQAARGTPTEPVQQITLDMVQGATITGRVYDANRQPAIAVPVGAYRVIYSDGHRLLTQTGSTVQSNDRADYRLFGLPPGEYYVRAGTAGSIGPSGGFRGQAGQRGFDPTANRGAGRGNYPSISTYPGTTDVKSAIPIVLRDGETRPGIDFDLQLAATATISGTIINTVTAGLGGPQEQGAQAFFPLYLVPHDSYFFEEPVLISSSQRRPGLRNGGSSNNSEVPFEVSGVPPGTYDVYAVHTDTTNTGNLKRFSARTTIDVGKEDVTGIRAVIQPGSNLNGHVTFTGAPPLALDNIRVLIRPKGNVPAMATPAGTAAAVGTDGIFTVANLIDVPYFIAGVSPLPDDVYVSDIRQDAHSIFDDNIIRIGKESDSKLEVVLSRGGGTIQGVVQDAKQNPVAAARITLIPNMPRQLNGLLYKTAISNATGSFNLNGIAPGNYKLFAWEHIPVGAEQNAEYMHDYDALGVSVVVSHGLPLANVQVPIIPAKR